MCSFVQNKARRRSIAILCKDKQRRYGQKYTLEKDLKFKRFGYRVTMRRRRSLFRAIFRKGQSRH